MRACNKNCHGADIQAPEVSVLPGCLPGLALQMRLPDLLSINRTTCNVC